MLGAIIGDVIGSVYEFNNIKTKDFPLFSPQSRFTDDTVLTLATIDALLHRKTFSQAYKCWYKKYPEAGYGRAFRQWAESLDDKPYNSWGNGSAMRVSPIGLYCHTMAQVLSKAKESAEVTHNHPEGIKGAQATAACIFLARTGKSKTQIKEYLETHFQYNLSSSLEKIRPWYRFDVSCQGSVPQAIIAFLESKDFEDAIRNAVSLGGDSDTIACITGAIAEAYYRLIPKHIVFETRKILDETMLKLLDSFYQEILNSS